VDPVEGRLAGDRQGLRTIPPGFARGLRLPGDESQDETLATLDEISVTSHRQNAETVTIIFWLY
jgi:antiviral helicase SKI2